MNPPEPSFVCQSQLVQISSIKCNKIYLKNHKLFYLHFVCPANKIVRGWAKALIHKRLPAPPTGRAGSFPPIKQAPVTGSPFFSFFRNQEQNAFNSRYTLLTGRPTMLK